MNPIVLVTGASGFIGSYLARQLVGDGSRLRVLVRRPELLPASVRARADVHVGDLRDRAAVSAAVAGAHTVLHLASCVKAWLREPEEFTAVNVHAVEALLAAAQRFDVQRLVHVSTILTLPPYCPAPPAGAAQQPTPYELSKRAGERLVESYAAAGRHACVVHPTRVYGPGPLHDANAVTKVVALYLAGRFRVRLDDGDVQSNWVHAADVATGIRLAACHGQPGAHYVLGGEDASFRGLLRLIAELSGVRRWVVALPAGAALATARTAELWGRLGGAAFITPGWVRVFLEDRRVDLEPERRALGYRPRSLRQGLAETIAWLRAGRQAAA